MLDTFTERGAEYAGDPTRDEPDMTYDAGTVWSRSVTEAAGPVARRGDRR